MAKISSYTAKSPIAGTDSVVIVDNDSTPATKKTLISTIASYLASLAQTLTNKTISFTNNTVTMTSAELRTACSDETGTGSLVFATSPTLVTPVLGTPSSGTLSSCGGYKETMVIAVGDETTAITTGTSKVTFRMPYAFTLTAVRASLATVSSSGIPTIDINEGGVTILSTKLTIDANEKTSTTAATAAAISDSALADDAEITIDIDVAGTGAAGLKVYLIGYHS